VGQAGLELHTIRRHDPSLLRVRGDAKCSPAVSFFATLAEIWRKSGATLHGGSGVCSAAQTSRGAGVRAVTRSSDSGHSPQAGWGRKRQLA
jgi:hypothetical protein